MPDDDNDFMNKLKAVKNSNFSTNEQECQLPFLTILMKRRYEY